MSPILLECYAPHGTGMSVAVKDCIDVAGSPTRCGSRAFEQAASAQRHAAVVQALVDGGCRIIGKAGMHELAYGVTGINGWTGTAENPNFPGLIPGGSSSGSAAAVAAGLAEIALGTDTGGSVRMPAACCGVIGFKPGFGRLSREGVVPRKTELDCVGVFALAMPALEEAMRRMDPTFFPADEPRAFRIGRVPVEADPEIVAVVDDALLASGGTVVPVPLELLPAAFRAGVVKMAQEASSAYGHFVGQGVLGADVEQRLRAAPSLSTREKVSEAERVRAAFVAEVDAALVTCDVLALPTLPDFPPRIADVEDGPALLRLTALVRPFNLSGHPAISLPLATPSGRPAALQLVGRRGDDARLCAIARRFAARR